MKSQTEGKKNVILLVFDTLRPDYLSCYGASSVESQNMDEVASTGVQFDAAFAAGPGTPISHGGIFTGQYPSRSGVTGQYIDLPEEYQTLPEWFNERGYKSLGIAGPSKIASDFGYDRGFDRYFEPYYDIGYQDRKPTKDYFKNLVSDIDIFRDGMRTAFRGEIKNTKFKFDYIKDWVRSNNEPFFVFANLLEAHAPYHPPRGYRRAFDPEFSEPSIFLAEYFLDHVGHHSDPDVRLDRIDHVQTGDGIGKYLADPSYLNEAELEVLSRWYSASIKYLDDMFGQFLEFYKSELADDTILVVTADHGEQLGEHGLIAHSHYLYDETLQVPLLMTGPDIDEAPDGLASLVDLYPTLANQAGIEVPEFTDGRKLFQHGGRDHVFFEHGERRIREFRESAHGKYLSDDQLSRFAAGRKAIRTDSYKLVIDSQNNTSLYDVTGSIETEIQAQGVEEDLAGQIEDTLSGEFGRWPEGDPESYSLDEEVIGSLEDLGYV
ncbi:sulfatase-like hydrolase/transferase [Haloarcula rubripromontorii]|uniref:Sulfatase-like hydrolase/transferase n=1 Tax=Haloarcula rubripromontorii TaxID=1705562 RepID=A0A847U1X0_9EURY|nr:sulfatase [Haloarcula rubripromontorii]NLV06467.1 sulfatase-like hydrolase/transferase [Haloarcula rubripromontorii]